MKPIWIFCALLTLNSPSMGDDSDYIFDRPVDMSVMENGTTIVADHLGIVECTPPYTKPVRVANGLKNVQQVRAWKNFTFLATSQEYWQRDPAGAYKKLLDQDVIAKLVGGSAKIQSIAIDANGNQFIAVGNEIDERQSALLRRTPAGKLTVELTFNQVPEFTHLYCMVSTGETALLVHSTMGNQTYIFCLLQKKIIGKLNLGPVKSMCYDPFGRLYILDSQVNCIRVDSPHPTKTKDMPQVVQTGKYMYAIAYNPFTNKLAQLGMDIKGLATQLPLGDPALPVDESHLPFTVAPAFPNIEWTGWEPINDKGVPVPLRPIVLTHANDQSGRTFVATQHGVIHVLPNNPDVKKTKIFLDIQDRVTYKDSQNEEGFLGLAFHPKYKQNGEFFVYYTKKPGLLSVVSRFKVSKEDPDKADPNSEEVLFTLKQPMWNHDGGTVCFGHDGYLYIGLGDGGGANDMFKNSRKMNTFHSKILRIDVDSKSDGKPYGIPKDNPFIGKEGVLPEIYCYGIRNVWRLAFDRKTGQGWFGEVGQNLYEEINLLEKGADYGWNARESFHPFGSAAQAANDKMVEPIWEYHHDVGKSITGGNVYRGKAYPELDGMYLYADYVSARIWALKYDFDKKRVVANREIKHRGLPIMSFGEDEDGEIYLLTISANGQGIDKIVRQK